MYIYTSDVYGNIAGHLTNFLRVVSSSFSTGSQQSPINTRGVSKSLS